MPQADIVNAIVSQKAPSLNKYGSRIGLYNLAF